jgi:hypothetical protein
VLLESPNEDLHGRFSDLASESVPHGLKHPESPSMVVTFTRSHHNRRVTETLQPPLSAQNVPPGGRHHEFVHIAEFPTLFSPPDPIESSTTLAETDERLLASLYIEDLDFLSPSTRAVHHAVY